MEYRTAHAYRFGPGLALLITLLLAWLAVAPNAQAAMACDVDDNGAIDMADIRAISAARNTPASGPDDPRDADGDGTITVNDARACVLQCSLPRCAPVNIINVPDVVGLPVDDATAAITAAGLTVGNITSQSDITVPEGSVIAQDPVGGEMAAPGSPVDLIVSAGADVDFLKPAVALTVSPSATGVNELVTITLTATDDLGIASTELLIDGVPVPLDAAGTAEFSSPTPGIFIAEGYATDAAGNTGFAQDEIRILVPGDTVPPTVAIASPAAFAQLDDLVDVIGTVSDTNLARYQIDIAVAGTNAFVHQITGTSEVVNGILGQLDPTRLRNGQYDLRLTAEDHSGNQASVFRTIAVQRRGSVGAFQLDFVDLTIPVAGLPIEVARAYDNRIKQSGDFGYGWNLAAKDVVVSESGVLGEGWQQTSSGGFFPTYSLSPTTPHRVTVTVGGKRTDAFEVVLNPSSQLLVPLQFVESSFAATPGTFTELVSLANNSLSIVPGQLLDNSTFEVWDPNRYRFTDTNGTVYTVNQFNGVEQVTDPNGNTLTFGTGGIIHSGGTSVSFTRDAQGRITQVTDPSGNVHSYQYDFYGDLVRYTDPLGQATTFAYDFDHNLLLITDARGVEILRNEYDSNGRVVAQEDALGGRKEYVYDVAARRQIVRDRLGNTTVLDYGPRGDLDSRTDALGNTSQSTFDVAGNVLTHTDALGNVSSFSYDARGNRLTATGPLGTITTWTYNAAGQVTSTTDASGITTTYSYDARGNLLTVTDALGNITSFSYDGAGRRVSITNPLGNVTTLEYDAVCRDATRTVNALGEAATATYTANCRPATRQDGNGNDTTLAYDANNRLVSEVFADGTSTLFEYSPTGQITRVTNAAGVTQHAYDARDDRVQTIDPAGNTISYTYDIEGNRVAVTSLAGATTFEYNALSQLVAATDNAGRRTTYAYDAVSRPIEQVSSNGARTQYTYDAAGRILSLVNEDSGVSAISQHAYTYDAVGNRLTATEAGRTESYTYDALHRIVEEVRNDTVLGNDTVTYAYDAAGNRISRTDSAGAVIHVYDAENRLLSAGTRTFTYDANGNRLSTTDGAALTTFVYDTQNRLTSAATPVSALTYEYDYAGNRTGRTVDGTPTRYIVDTHGDRPMVLAEQDGAGTIVAANAIGLELISQDRGGMVSLLYRDGDSRTRVLTALDESVTDTYTYDGFGLLLGATGATDNPNRLGGGLFDAATELTAFGSRNYDPTTGGFLSPLVAPLNLFDPLSSNRYLYLRANPLNPDAGANLNLIDQTGRISSVENTIEQALREIMLPD